MPLEGLRVPLRRMGFPLQRGTTRPRLRRHAPAAGAHARGVLRELRVPAPEVRRRAGARAARAT
jgi:hypothetical protein